MTGLPARSGTDPADTLTQMIDQIAGTLTLAVAFAENGRAINLAGLDQDVSKICSSVLALPAEQGYALRPALRMILTLLDHVQKATSTSS